MTEEELHRLAQQAVHDLGIDEPIYHVQVAGNNLFLHLPHRVVEWPIPAFGKLNRAGRQPIFQDYHVKIIGNPAMYGRDELKVMADLLNITGVPYRKKELVKAINNWKEENQWTP